MSKDESLDSAMDKAGELEKNYDWLGAAEFYKKAMGLVSEMDFLKMGEVQERIGYALYRAAMQAKNVNEFGDRMHQAVANYQKAKELFGRLCEPGKTSKPGKTSIVIRCDAMMAYMCYWLVSEVAEKRRLLDECWQLTKEALKAFEEAGNAPEYGKTYNQLSHSCYFRFNLEWNNQTRERIVREAVEHGERAITLLATVRDPLELAKAYLQTGLYLNTFCAYYIPDLDEKARHYQKSLDYWQKANELSEETALLELLSPCSDSFTWNNDEMLVHYEKALGCAKKTKDKFLIGTALDWLAYANWWKHMGSHDPEKRAEAAQTALQCAEDAKHEFSLISFESPRGGGIWTGAPHAEYYWSSALQETDLRKRRDLLENAVMDATRAIKLAENSGYPEIVRTAHHVLSKALGSLAQIEKNLDEKKRLLEEALKHRNESIRITQQIAPFSYWNEGVTWNYLADLKAELSDFEKDSENRKNMLKEAISNKERSLELCIKENLLFEKKGDISHFSALGKYQYSYGELLTHLYGLTNNKEHQERAIKAFEDAVESFKKLNLVSRMAECHWKAARSYDALGEHIKAAESFDLASNNYTSTAESIPQLKDFCQEYSLYMQAWSQIENARHHHQRQEYGIAKQYYEKAASMHKSLRQWSYLTPNYSAWAQVENAEDLSRKEQSEEAIQAFEQAAKRFTETKKSLHVQLNSIENPDEKQMATDLIKATDLRRQYCVGRIALEEAKILDKKGDHYSSSQKYGSAAQTFEKITEELVPEHDRKELRLIAILSRAWQKMTCAEAESSFTYYIEASRLFEEAKEFSPNEQARLLALGHSRFCRALEVGTRFVDTRDAALHATAIHHLESAANYYVKAGFQSASEYAKATELLFDAYVHMDNARRESDPEKKAKLYAMTEKVLQTSAGSFMKAKHPEKRQQVIRLLKMVRKDRELALSLNEALHTPLVVSSTATFATPTPTHEKAVGLEKFENADIQANIITRQKDLKVGENLDLEIELVNAGKAAALLIKVTEVVPEGFELKEKPEKYRVEDNYLNMKGKRLDPLRTEEIRLVLKPKVHGVFPLKPRVLYLDENGKYKSHELEPITITVKELGISGWLKGP